MALVTDQVQGSYTTFTTRPVLRSRGIESKQFGIKLPVVERTDRFVSLKCKCKPCLRVGAPFFLGPKKKLLKISSFKGIGQNEESIGRVVGSKSSKESVKLSAADETTKRSRAIQNLFVNWLTLLRTPSSPNQVVDEVLEGPSSKEILETQNGMQKNERGEILRAVWCSFVDLDTMIKIPLLIFIPLYLAINVVFGAEVSKELTPLWVFGPLIVSVYIKMLQAISGLYFFSFNQTVKVVKNLPTYYLVAHDYIASGKLKDMWQLVVNFKSLDYKEVSKDIMRDLNAWLVDRYLDFIELIWPTYCRTIRFLKRANFI